MRWLNEEREDWLVQHLAEVVIGVFGFGIILALAVVAIAGAATTDHPEGDIGGPGTKSIVVHQHLGHETIVETGGYKMSPARARAFNIEQQGYLPSGKYNCRVAWQKITREGDLNIDIAKTYHQLQWCYNGNRVLSWAAQYSCQKRDYPWWVGTWSAVTPVKKVQWYLPWQGSGHGSIHSLLVCHYFGDSKDAADHRTEIVGLGNGNAVYTKDDQYP
jgi:hypothetical protein